MQNFRVSNCLSRFHFARLHSTDVPGRVGGGIKLRKDLALREPTAEEIQMGDHRSGVVLSKRVPEEFIQNTLLPHLEERMRSSIHVYTPTQLVQVTRSYAKYAADREDRGAGPLIEKLFETVKYRMPGFEAIDIIDILPSALMLAPEDDELFGMIADRMNEKIDDFNALNLVGGVRVYLKRGDVQIVKDLLLPRLIESLKSYDSIEIAEMLIAIGQATGTDVSLSGDVHILQCLVPEVEQKFDELPLVVQLNCLWALAKLNVNHKLMRDTVVSRFCDPKLVADLPTKVLSKAIWIFGRIGAWKDSSALLETILPVVKTNRSLFNASEFGRIVMGLSQIPQARDDLVAVANRLVESLGSQEEMDREPETSTRRSRQEVMMTLSGLERLGMISGPNASILKPVEAFLVKEQNKFEPNEIQQLVSLFHRGPNDAIIDSSLFPATWKEIVASSRKRLDQIVEHY
jgi:hypothetical protein